MPICPCCQRDLSERTIRQHRKDGPSSDDQIRAYSYNPSRKPFPPRPTKIRRDSNLKCILSTDLIAPDVIEALAHEPPPCHDDTCIEEIVMREYDDDGLFSGSESSDPMTPSPPAESGTDEEDSTDSDEELAQVILEKYEQEFLATQMNELYPQTCLGLARSILDPRIVNNIKMFSLYIEAKLTRESLKLFKKFFGNTLDLVSHYKMEACVAALAQISTQTHHCCIKSCIAFIGDFSKLTACPFCKHPRLRHDGKPYSTFEYIPLIPRLQAYYGNIQMITKLEYRTTRVVEPNEYTDIFDGILFSDICRQPVTVDGKQYPFKPFEYATDIALGLSSDGVKIFKHGSDLVWPFFLINYSLSPEIRNRLPYLIPLMVIPGPHEPKDHNSFLIPFRDEMNELARGVSTFNTALKKEFSLHAYVLTKIADMQAFKKNQYIRGPNAFSPCRSCEIQGCRNPEVQRSNYYYPLRPPTGATSFLKTTPQIWNPNDLPLRTQESYKRSLVFINSTTRIEERERRAKTLGLNGESILVNLPGFDRARSGPHDFMHLMYENIQKILIKLWTRLMPFDTNLDQPYFIPEYMWNLIGEETHSSTKTIPSYFCRLLPNIATDQYRFIAESWSFWFCYLAPYLLKDRLAPPYYTHLLDLVDINKMCMQLSITVEEIDQLEQKIIKWVTKYERLYYEYNLERLPACTSCIHAFLHVANDIRQTGPVWVNWAFKTERFVGSLVSVVKSRRFPYAAITRRLIHKTQLNHIALIYDLPEILPEPAPTSTQINSQEFIYPEAPLTVFRQPCHTPFTVDATIHKKIALHLTAEFTDKSISQLVSMVPTTMEMWEKVRILGGDCIRIATNKENLNGRDQSFVRYDLQVDKYSHKQRHDSEFFSTCFYGQLHLILVSKLLLNSSSNQRHRFWAVVESCETAGKDATKELVTYTKMSGRKEVIELQAISCVIGRVKIGASNRWGIIDRSNDMMRPSLVADSDDKE